MMGMDDMDVLLDESRAPLQQEYTASGSVGGGRHLFVCSHGFMGNPGHIGYLVAQLKAHPHSHRLLVINPDVNKHHNSLDGIDVCGDRLIDEIERVLQVNSDITHISFIGYSQGGLILRYVIGRLYSEEYFSRIIPVNFVTFASPHLGVRRPARRLHDRVANYLVARMASHSGLQMLLADNQGRSVPLLARMAAPGSVYFRGLALFQQRVLYASVASDRTVPYCTASIQPHNVYKRAGVRFRAVDGYRNIVTLVDEGVAAASEETKETSALIGSLSDNMPVKMTYGQWTMRVIRDFALVMLILLPLSPLILLFLALFYLVSIYSRVKVRAARRNYKPPREEPVDLDFTASQDSWRGYMIAGLAQLTWKRVDVYIPGATHTHGLIVVRRPKSMIRKDIDTSDIIDHLNSTLIMP